LSKADLPARQFDLRFSPESAAKVVLPKVWKTLRPQARFSCLRHSTSRKNLSGSDRNATLPLAPSRWLLARRQEVRITALRTSIVRLPLPQPILSATLEIHSTDAVLVFLDTDEGVTGEGLCFALNGNRLKLLHDMVRSFEPLLIGLDPTMAASFYKRGQLFGKEVKRSAF
jgi:hypothetical protein